MDFRTRPDYLRLGLINHRVAHKTVHPLQDVLTKGASATAAQREALLGQTMGSAMPIAQRMETMIASRPLRLATLPQSNLALCTLTNQDEKFGFEDWHGSLESRDPTEVNMVDGDAHAAMERRLGMKIKM